MKTERMTAFTDGVVAIIITIMVLELKVPESTEPRALLAAAPILGAYILSYINVGLYWNNHHHLLQAASRVDGRGLWANLFLLFWLSLVPFVIRWMDEAGFGSMPVAAYGFVLGMAAIGYRWLQHEMIRINGGRTSRLADALGQDWKGKMSVLGYLIAIPLAFVTPWIAVALYVIISGVWLVPDQRIEKRLMAD
ncbi:TMEM175 family protein [Sphingomonas abietis]|uniref:TMEM175 family protein n=1 Tax=Sphingomonas abietis TaxID=3012344 RepID=A0ABY7NS44_9SPHN|nr:TMEM175 family protein [Sphingomonas abietis]WBO22784.1 TMEM175 family protein [Sphingomonas abietis]